MVSATTPSANNLQLAHAAPRNSNPRQPDSTARLPPKPISPLGIRKARNHHRNLNNLNSPSTPLATRPWSRRSASWTVEEDEKLKQLVRKEISGPPSITASKTWSRVAAMLPRRTGKQCRERYLNQLKPGIRRDPWTSEEELTLHAVHARLGNKWVAIAKHLPGRTDNCVKNHWNSMLRKRQRREAALRTTQRQVSVSLFNANGPNSDLSLKHVDTNIPYPQCTTPSELSSYVNDFGSSGVPSPFNVSSPLTPARDSKLHVSSIFASSGREPLSWNAFENVRDIAVASEHVVCPKTPHYINHQAVGMMPSPLSALVPIMSSFKASHAAAASAPGFCRPELARNPRQQLFSGTEKETIDILSRIDHHEPKNISPLSSSKKGSKLRAGNQWIVGVQEKPIVRTNTPHPVMCNPLAALAAAASTVPYSPMVAKPLQNAVTESPCTLSSHKP